MPVPSPRNSVRIARGNIADLQANAGVFGDGEIIYSIDEDIFYSASNGTLFQVGRGIITGESIDALADVDTSTVSPGVGQVLKWDGANWVPADDSNTDAVTSVAGKTGDVTLVKADITDFSDGDYATAAQGILADSATQPGDNISTLTNDAAYITSAGAPVQSVASKTGAVTLVKADITDFADGDYATAAQGALADSAVQPGDNISTLTNDSAFVDAAGASAAAPVQSVASKTGDVTLVKGDVGLDQVDNTSDASKPISTATQSALGLKADLVGGVVPNSQLPSLAITEYLGTVASEAALLALTGQRGDWAIRTDTGSTWVITTDGGSTITDWTELATPADAVSSVNGFTGTVVLGASDVGAATAAQGTLADGAVQSAGDTMTGALGMPVGSESSPSVYFDANTGLYSPGAGQLAIATGGTGRLLVDASGRVGIGTTSPDGNLVIQSNSTNSLVKLKGSSSTNGGQLQVNGTDLLVRNRDNGSLEFWTNDSQKALIDSSGRLLVGTSTATTLGTTSFGINQFSAGNVSNQGIFLENGVNGGGYGQLVFAKNRQGIPGGTTIVQSGDPLGASLFYGADGTKYVQAANIAAFVDGTPGANDMPGRLVFSTTADGASIPTERMRIDSSGNLGLGTSSPQERLDVAGDGASYLRWQQSGVGGSYSTSGGVLRIAPYFAATDRELALFVDNSNIGWITTGTTNALSIGTNKTSRIHISSSGRVGVGITSPGVDFDVAGKIRTSTGILFGSDTATANTLDDYEEGTWTPLYLVDTGDPGYTITATDSVYTKIGRLVCLRWYAVISDQTGQIGGNLRVRGIPFAPAETEFVVGRGGYTSSDTVPNVRTSWTGFDVVSGADSIRSLFLKSVVATDLANTRAFFTVMYRV